MKPIGLGNIRILTDYPQKISPNIVQNGEWIFIFILEVEGRHASAITQEAVDHLASFPPSREDISQRGFEPQTSSLIWVSLHHHLVV